MSKFSNIIRPANAIPHWPFTINRQSEQARGLIGWWPGVGASGKLLDLAGGYDGVNQTAGNPLGFDALGLQCLSDSWSLLPTNVDITKAITLSAWATLTDSSNYRHIIAKRDGSSTNYALRTAIDSGLKQIEFYWNNGGYNIFGSTGDIITARVNLLTHWLVTYTDGVTPQLYVNGLGVAGSFLAGSTVSLATNTAAASIGAIQDGSELWAGKIGDVRVYNRALSASEVWALYDPATRYELYQPLSRRVYSIPAASADQTAILPLLEAANSLYAPTVVPAALTLTLPRIEATESIYSPTVSAGAVTAVLPAISADGAAYAPTVAPATVTETLPLISPTGELYAPTVVEAGTTAVLPQLAANGAFYSPTIIFDQTLALPQLVAAGALYAPSVVENLAAGIRVTISNAPVLNLTLADASVLTLTASDDLAEG